MVAQGIPQPLHIGPLNAQVNEIRRRFRDDTEPGDAFIVNHPYQACQNHATDVTVISPIFVRGRIAGYIGNIAHKPDLGGKVPGTNSGDATDLFQEGLLIPPTKILRRGKMNEDVQNLICANTRTPEVTWGDIRAQVNTNTYGISKFTELFDKYGIGAVQSCLAALDGYLRNRTAQGDRQGSRWALWPRDRLSRRRRRRADKAAPHLGHPGGEGRHVALHSRQRRAGAGADQSAALRVAQFHRMPGEDDLHPATAGQCRAVAAGEGVLPAGRLAAQSAVSGAGQYVCAAEPDHDLGRDANPGAGRSRAACRLPAAPPAARSAARGAIRFRGAGIRNTRSWRSSGTEPRRSSTQVGAVRAQVADGLRPRHVRVLAGRQPVHAQRGAHGRVVVQAVRRPLGHQLGRAGVPRRAQPAARRQHHGLALRRLVQHASVVRTTGTSSWAVRRRPG